MGLAAGTTHGPSNGTAARARTDTVVASESAAGRRNRTETRDEPEGVGSTR